MADLQQLIRQRAELERQIAQLNSQGRQDAIEEIRAIMSAHGLSSEDISLLQSGLSAVVSVKVR